MIAFAKYHGCGNDFVIIALEQQKHREFSELAAALCDRHFGIGSDGLLLIDPMPIESRVPITLTNPDGSPMGMCGNGLRCLYRWLCDHKYISFGAEIVFKTAEGREVSAFVEHKHPALLLDSADFSPSKIPIASKTEAIGQPLVVDGRKFEVTCLSVGNPHCVVFQSGLNISEWGPRFEQHEFFPERTNFEVVAVESRSRLRVEIWERGAGKTLACGTGALAAVAAANRIKLVDSPCEVILAGGTLSVSLNPNGMILSGPAEPVFSGVWNGVPESQKSARNINMLRS